VHVCEESDFDLHNDDGSTIRGVRVGVFNSDIPDTISALLRGNLGSAAALLLEALWQGFELPASGNRDIGWGPQFGSR